MFKRPVQADAECVRFLCSHFPVWQSYGAVHGNTINSGGGFMLRAGDLRQKEVINISSGMRLGFVSDVEIDFESGRIDAIVIPGKDKMFLFGRAEDYVIPWKDIKRVGDDIILVDIPRGEYGQNR